MSASERFLKFAAECELMAKFTSSSPLKNVESSAFSVFLSSNSWGDRLVVSCCRLGRQQFGNADQVVGDQIEHEIGSDLGYAAMFCFAHRAVLFAPTEDAFDHRPARLR